MIVCCTQYKYLYSQDNYTNPILLKEMYTLKQFPIFSFDIELKTVNNKQSSCL